ncbi:unnamed protein product, partial [Brassicogethes aeneus]
EDEKLNFIEDFVTKDSIYVIKPKDVELENQSLLDSLLTFEKEQNIVTLENIERNINEECRRDCQVDCKTSSTHSKVSTKIKEEDDHCLDDFHVKTECDTTDTHVSIDWVKLINFSEKSGNTHSKVIEEIKEEEHCLDDFYVKTESKINGNDEYNNSHRGDESKGFVCNIEHERRDNVFSKEDYTNYLHNEDDKDEAMLETKIEVENHGVETNICDMIPNKSGTEKKVGNFEIRKIIIVTTRRKRKRGSFKCVICEKVFTSGFTLKTHLNAVHLKIFKKCPHCDFKTPYDKILKRHQNVKHEGVFQKCPYCTEALDTKKNLDFHVQTMHKAQNKIERKITITNNFKKCDNCKKVLNYGVGSSRYGKHANVCFGFDKDYFFCQLCPHKSARIANLLKHIRLHKNYTTYQCNFCDYNSLTQALIDRHITIQHKELVVKNSQLLSQPIYWCDTCDFRSIIKKNFDRHIAECFKV